MLPIEAQPYAPDDIELNISGHDENFLSEGLAIWFTFLVGDTLCVIELQWYWGYNHIVLHKHVILSM